MVIVNNILWCIAIIMLLISGIYYSFKLNFLHLNFKKMFQSLKNNQFTNDGISALESLSISLGACIGVGSLAGIALAIYKGGIGTIFWILISCLFIVPNSIVENTLAIIYRKREKNNYLGGPAHYIKDGLGYKKLSLVYAILIVIAYLFGFLTIQSNTISKLFENFFRISPLLIGVIVGSITFFIILKGVKGIAKFSSFFVPFMSCIYIIISLFIFIKNINLIPEIIKNIVATAFNFKSFGYGVFSAMIIGIQRGIFASEAGCGTVAIASGSSNIKKPIKQGLISALGVYFTVFVICASTAFIILTSNYSEINYIDVNGIEITNNALFYHLGNFGSATLYFCLIAFSFSTIVSGYYYIESNIKFIFKNISEKFILLLKVFTCLVLLIATIISPTFIWNISDILVALLTIINIFAIFSLRNDVIREYVSERKNNYDRK